jgi:hypothetical protein
MGAATSTRRQSPLNELKAKDDYTRRIKNVNFRFWMGIVRKPSQQTFRVRRSLIQVSKRRVWFVSVPKETYLEGHTQRVTLSGKLIKTLE